jgi:hypothetical protein
VIVKRLKCPVFLAKFEKCLVSVPILLGLAEDSESLHVVRKDNVALRVGKQCAVLMEERANYDHSSHSQAAH